MTIDSANSNISEIGQLLACLSSLPAHEEDRFETVDGYDNPDCTNGLRAQFARAALETFQQACHMKEAPDTASADLICDLLHLVHAEGFEPLQILESALAHFAAEAGPIARAGGS